MIRKIKTSINCNYKNDEKDDRYNNSSNTSYDIDSKNVQVEELDLNTYDIGNNSLNNNVITEEAFLNAVNDNFNNNRNTTNEMNKQIYNVFMEKIAEYASNHGGDI